MLHGLHWVTLCYFGLRVNADICRSPAEGDRVRLYENRSHPGAMHPRTGSARCSVGPEMGLTALRHRPTCGGRLPDALRFPAIPFATSGTQARNPGAVGRPDEVYRWQSPTQRATPSFSIGSQARQTTTSQQHQRQRVEPLRAFLVPRASAWYWADGGRTAQGTKGYFSKGTLKGQ